VFGRRPDATLARDLPAIRRFMPFISPRRNESLVYFAHDLPVERALAFVEERNRTRPADRPMTLFHLLLRALVRILDERPRLNRFTAGGRVWQRDGIWISFSAKKAFDDASPIITVKRRFDPGESLDQMVDGLHDGLAVGRSDRKSTSDHEMDILLRLPPSLVKLALACVRGVNALGLLPKAMIDGDPMYASAFVANLGSVGLEAGYHHLWEYGTIPIFCVVGRVKPGPDGARIVTLKWSYDERVEDGLYCARSLEIFRALVEAPEKL
jgi:hypothetical protein